MGINKGILALKVGLALVMVVAIAAVPLAYMSLETVDEGNVKVVKEKGSTTGQYIEPGWEWTHPLYDSTATVETRPQVYTMSGDPWEGNNDKVDSIELYTDDEQQANVDVTVRYKVPPDQSVQFYDEWKNVDQAEKRVIRPVVQSVAQSEGSEFDSRNLISKDGRNTLSTEIESTLESEFENSGLVVQSVQVRDIHLDPSYTAELERVEIEHTKADQKRIAAEADREAYQIRNEGLTDAVLMEKYIESIDESSTVVLATDNNGTPVILDGLEGSGSGNYSASSDDMYEDGG